MLRHLSLRHDHTIGIWFMLFQNWHIKCTLRVLSPAALSLMYGDTHVCVCVAVLRY